MALNFIDILFSGGFLSLKTKSHNLSLLQAAPICSDGRPSGAWSSEAYSSPLPLCCLLRFALSLSSVEILSAVERAPPRGF